MFKLWLSIVNLDPASEEAFSRAAGSFLLGIRSQPDLRVQVGREMKPGTRGIAPLLTDIILTGTSLGAFAAIYSIYKDFCELYANAEVQLRFRDGSTVTLKYLTRQEAERILREHLEDSDQK